MQYLDADQDTIVKVLADVLTALCQTNDELPPPVVATKFHAACTPTITIYDYLIRIRKYAQCSTQCFVLALIYIDRLIQGCNTFVICSLNVHRILITTIMLAAKFFDDQYYNNKYYARIGGVGSDEINLLEVEFLFMTNFQLYVSPEVYIQYYKQLCEHIANTKQGDMPYNPKHPPIQPDQSHPQYQQLYEQYQLDMDQWQKQQLILQAQPHVVHHQQQLQTQIDQLDDLKRHLIQRNSTTMGQESTTTFQSTNNTSMGQDSTYVADNEAFAH